MKKLILTLLLSAINVIAHSQSVQLDWVKSFDTLSVAEGHNVLCDENGNVYAIGNASTIDPLFDADPSESGEAFLDYPGTFLAKYSSTGDYLWSVSLGTANEGSANVHGDICFDNSGDILFSGSFIGEVDFDPSSNNFLASSEFGSFFIAKYSPEGSLIFAEVMPLSSAAFFAIKGIDSDEQGNIYVGGSLQDNGAIASIDFDPGIGVSELDNESGSAFFILKYSNSGDLIFSEFIAAASGSSSNRLIDLKLDAQENIWITGEILGAIDFDPSANENIIDDPNRSIFLAKYSSSGEFIHVIALNGQGTKFCREIAIDAEDNIYIGGEYRDTIDCDPSMGENIFVSQDNFQPFLAKYSNDGDLMFALNFESDTNISSNNSLRTITTDKLGYVYISGYIKGSCDFDPSDNEFIVTPTNEYEAYIAKYDEQGNFIWVTNMAGSNFTFTLDMEVNTLGVVTVSGLFRTAADFDPGEGNTETIGGFSNTMFIARYSPCFYSNDEVALCQGDVYQASTRSLSEAGEYQVSYLSSAGCDSIVSLSLTVNELPNNLVFMNSDLAFECEQTGAGYQWYTCESNEAILGATNQSFLPSEPGIYFVEITLNGCSINSECMNTQIVSLKSISDSDIKIYPNPGTSNVFIQCKAGNKIDLFNIEGRLVYSQTATSNITELRNLPKPGVYFIQISNAKSSNKMQKLILQ
jgi:hypothetical protein